MSTYDYAKSELERAGYFDGDINQAMANDVMHVDEAIHRGGVARKGRNFLYL